MSENLLSRTGIINFIISRYGYKSYLEIGVQAGINFKQINIADKIGVDTDNSFKHPNMFYGTSDIFFEQNNKKFDCIFIDGSHEAPQVYKDIVNSVNSLSDNGIIVMHDCLPPDENHQIVPRIQSMWTGDVWKAFVSFRENHNTFDCFVLNTDYGVGIIKPTNTQLPTFKAGAELNWENFQQNTGKWLNLTNPTDLAVRLNSIPILPNTSKEISDTIKNNHTIKKELVFEKEPSDISKIVQSIVGYVEIMQLIQKFKNSNADNGALKMITNKDFNFRLLNIDIGDLSKLKFDFPLVKQVNETADADVVGKMVKPDANQKKFIILDKIEDYIFNQNYPIPAINHEIKLSLLKVFYNLQT